MSCWNLMAYSCPILSIAIVHRALLRSAKTISEAPAVVRQQAHQMIRSPAVNIAARQSL